MKKIVTTTLLLAILSLGFSQSLTQTIKGQIVDEQSGTPIIGATAQVVGISPPLGAITDANGYYRIDNVPIGRQNLQVSYLGYEPAFLSEILVGSGKEVVIDIRLIESLQQLDEVVVTANSQEKGQPQNELATISAISISVEETSRYASTFDDPARVALTYAGVQTGGDDLLNEIVIRGNSPKGILWRMEGVEIPNPNHFGEQGSSAGGISMLSSAVLANSDFFTGAFPAQYGNATSGIFDLNLRKGNFDKREHSFQAGLLGIAASSEGPISSNSRGSYLVNYRYSTLGILSAVGLDILGEQEEITFQDLSFKFHLPTKKLGSFSLWGLGGSNVYTYLPDLAFGETFYEDASQDMGVVGLTNVLYISDDSFFETILSASHQNISYKEDSLRIMTFDDESFIENQVRFSTFYSHKFSARHTMRVGAIFSRLSYNLREEFYDENEERYITAIDAEDHTEFYQTFANWQYRLNNNLTLNTGLHYSQFALNNKSYLEPRAGFKWNTGKQIISGGFGLHSRMETVALYTVQQEREDGSLVQANKDLGFTQAIHGAIGYERLLRNDMRFKAEAYYQYLYNVPVWSNDTTSRFQELTYSTLNRLDGFDFSELANDGTGRNFGVEFTLEKFLTNGFYLLSTASLYRSLYSGSDGVERSTAFDGGYIFNILGGKEISVGKNGNNTLGLNGKIIMAGGKRQPPINLTASLEEGSNVFDFQNNYELQLDDFFRVDIGISYRKNREKTSSVISLSAQNLTQRENESFRFFDSRRQEIVSDTQLSFFPNLSYKIEF